MFLEPRLNARMDSPLPAKRDETEDIAATLALSFAGASDPEVLLATLLPSPSSRAAKTPPLKDPFVAAMAAETALASSIFEERLGGAGSSFGVSGCVLTGPDVVAATRGGFIATYVSSSTAGGGVGGGDVACNRPEQSRNPLRMSISQSCLPGSTSRSVVVYICGLAGNIGRKRCGPLAERKICVLPDCHKDDVALVYLHCCRRLLVMLFNIQLDALTGNTSADMSIDKADPTLPATITSKQYNNV